MSFNVLFFINFFGAQTHCIQLLQILYENKESEANELDQFYYIEVMSLPRTSFCTILFFIHDVLLIEPVVQTDV